MEGGSNPDSALVSELYDLEAEIRAEVRIRICFRVGISVKSQSRIGPNGAAVPCTFPIKFKL